MRRIIVSLAAVSLLAVCFCGKDPQSADPGYSYASDTLAVRAILDANGLGTTTHMVATTQGTDGGITRVTELRLIASTLGAASAIDTIPPQIARLTALINLQLSGNRIRSLPSGISALTKVTHLSIANNNLAGLPAEIGSMSALRSLNLGNNSISSLPTAIGNLQYLNSLFVNNNLLTSLPDTLAGMDSLTQNLDYDYNRICDPLSTRLQQKLTSMGIDPANSASTQTCP